MEMFDELDENGCFTGNTISRDEAHKAGAWHRAVVLNFVSPCGKVLLQKRSKHKKTWPGCWDISCGGHVEAGCLGLEAAVREAEEELGIHVDSNDVRFISCVRSDNKSDRMWDRHFNDYFVAVKDVDVTQIKLQENEVDEIKWVDFADFKKMVARRDETLTSKWDCHEALVMYVDKYLAGGK